MNSVRPRIFEGVVARVHQPGDALEYATGPEHRDLDELQRIVDQLAGLPIVTYDKPDSENVLSHPEDLISNGADYYEIGRVISGRVDDGKAVATVYIHDKGALEGIADGTKELSLGYRCSLDEQRYQRNIILDHLSVVPRARCGEVCALRTDALASSVPDAKPATMAELTTQVTIVLDEESKQILRGLAQPKADEVSVEIEVGESEECASCGASVPADAEKCSKCGASMDACKSKKRDAAPKAECTCNSRAMSHTTEEPTMDAAEIQKKLDEALAEIATLKANAEKSELELNQAKADCKAETARADKLAGELEAVKADAQAKVDAAQKARTDEEDKAFRAAVDARVELLDDAAKVGVENAKALSDREIKVAIVKKVDEMDIEDTRSADYVNGMYAGAMKRHAKAAASVAEVRTVIVENRDSAAETNIDPLKTEAEIAAAAEAKRKNRWR